VTQEPEEKRSRWPIIIVLASIAILIITFAVGVYFSSPSPEGGAAQPTSVDSMEAQISIFDFSYRPGDLSVPRGAEVTWFNDDKVQHTATELGSEWDTGSLSEGDGAAVTFTRPGTYEYYCTIHPYMAGKLTVR